MHLFLTIIAFIVIFSVLILVHEWGHFFTARKSGIKVEEFGFGLPPKIWGKKIGDVLYSINAIPFGGFVRLLGEDARDEKTLKDKKSFSAKPARIRIMVVVAGVVMNFLLAWLLLSIGFMVGMQPLILTGDDLIANIDSGNVQVLNGVSDTSNDKQVLDMPRVFVAAVKLGTEADQAGLKAGDAIINLNGKGLYYGADVGDEIATTGFMHMDVLRDGKMVSVNYNQPNNQRVIVTSVADGTAAAKAGIKSGDVILAVGGKTIDSYLVLLGMNQKGAGQALDYKVKRGQQMLDIPVTPDKDGLVGIYLSNISNYENQEFSYYEGTLKTTIGKINDVKYSPLVAPFKAFDEMEKLSVLTVKMFGNVLTSVFTKFTVPEGVSGPVGIAKMTYTFVGQGFVSLMRFMAMLSLSLAIINVLPFPALDGGRLLFIILEVVFGRRVGSKVEAWVHRIGFLLLLILIGLVTYSDIFK